jgi:hypothetical protein
MKYKFLPLIAVLPLVLAGCCCVPAPVCMQPPGLRHYVPAPHMAPVGPMYRPYAPVVPVSYNHNPVAHPSVPRFPVRRHRGLVRHGWPITQAYSGAEKGGWSEKQACPDCHSRCDCNCEQQIHVCDTKPADCSAPRAADCSAPCGESCGLESGCFAPVSVGRDSRVFMPPGTSDGSAGSNQKSVQPPPVPPTPPLPNAAAAEPPHEVQLVVPPADVGEVNYVRRNSSLPPKDFRRSVATSADYETFQSTTIPAKTEVHKRIE